VIEVGFGGLLALGAVGPLAAAGYLALRLSRRR
jgi:hypothetical protein